VFGATKRERCRVAREPYRLVRRKTRGKECLGRPEFENKNEVGMGIA
jgi:hypothetical protein